MCQKLQKQFFIYFYLFNPIIFKNSQKNKKLMFTENKSTHEQKVQRISEQLKNRTSTKPVSLKKKAVSHEVPKPNDKRHKDEKIDISDLNEILTMDKENKICIAEPGITFVELVKETLKHNLVPITVPEFKTITIGGAVAGCSIESMSYKYGGFHDSCIEYEVITAKGEVINCSNKNNQLMFQMMHGTFGTLGIISKLKFKLIEAKPFVKVTYTKYETLEEYKSAIQNHYQNKDVDFMDGIIHSPTEYILSTAMFVDTAPYTHSYDWMRIYYLSTKNLKEDYIKIIDYFFRYDRGVTNVSPKSFIGRLFFGKFLNSNQVLKLANKFHKIIPNDKIPITVDTFLPFSKVTEFMEWYGKEVNFFPLWCVPYKTMRKYEWLNQNFLTEDELFLDLAIYGMKKTNKEHYYQLIENELLKVNAIKTLISSNYYSEEDFWKVWNKENYFKIKQQTDPNNIFRDLYTKTCKTTQGLE